MRASILARTRAPRHAFAIGDWCYYWRRNAKKLEYHWYGPVLVCAQEASNSLMISCYWLAHGAQLIRATHEQMRPQYPEEATEQTDDPSEAGERREPPVS